jgi:biopolymer transport protein ExbB/TolQ
VIELIIQGDAVPRAVALLLLTMMVSIWVFMLCMCKTWMLRGALHQELHKLQFGQVLLATVEATAPFLGLLCTVWGIHHTLIGVAAAGQISIDKVAGLAVAIPAVLGYNLCGRLVGRIEADLEGFGRDLRDLLTHGEKNSLMAPGEKA